MTCGFSRTERHPIVPIFVWTDWRQNSQEDWSLAGSLWMASLQSWPQSVRFLPLGIPERQSVPQPRTGSTGPTQAEHWSGNSENRIRSYWSSDVISEIARSRRHCWTWRMDGARAELLTSSKIASERTIPDRFRWTQLKQNVWIQAIFRRNQWMQLIE